MPDPFLYLRATGAAAIVSAIVALAMLRRGADGDRRANVASALAISFGLIAGYYVLSLHLTWPPANGLDRFLTWILPAVVAIELVASIPRVPTWATWLLRYCLAALLPRVLLHGSVYLSGSDYGWERSQAFWVLAISSGLLLIVWGFLTQLSRRSPGVSVPISLCLAIQCAGVTIMMAGYLKGGSTAFPLLTVIGVTIGVAAFRRRRASADSVDGRDKVALPAIIGIAVVGLFGLLFIGRFFGEISTATALTILFAPLLGWVTELSWLRNRNPWTVGMLRIVIVAVPLLIILLQAKRDFDREMAPLISHASSACPLPTGDDT